MNKMPIFCKWKMHFRDALNQPNQRNIINLKLGYTLRKVVTKAKTPGIKFMPVVRHCREVYLSYYGNPVISLISRRQANFSFSRTFDCF